MLVDIIMPKMGESVNEGTIIKWHKKTGDKVERDEIIFEISTDKVDTEIPSPAEGVLKEIRVKEGDTVEVGTVVAIVDDDSSSENSVVSETKVEEKVIEEKPADEQKVVEETASSAGLVEIEMPFDNRSFVNAFAHFGHDDVHLALQYLDLYKIIFTDISIYKLIYFCMSVWLYEKR